MAAARKRKPKPRKSTHTRRPVLAYDQRELAALCDRALSTINHHLNSTAWPFARTPPWNVDDVREWLQTRSDGRGAAKRQPPRPRGIDGPKLHILDQARLSKLLKEGTKLDIGNRYAEGKLMERDQVRRELAEALIRFRSRLLTVPRRVADDLETTGMVESTDKIGCERILQEIIDQALENLATAFNGAADRPNPKTVD